MLLSLVITAAIVISGFAVTWMGIELMFYPPKSAQGIRNVRIALGVSFLVLLTFSLWATIRGEDAMKNLPKQVADYLRTSLHLTSNVPAPALEAKSQVRPHADAETNRRNGMSFRDVSPERMGLEPPDIFVVKMGTCASRTQQSPREAIAI